MKKLKYMTKTVTYMAMYGASKRKAKKLARAANPRMPARKVAKIVNLVFGNWSAKCTTSNSTHSCSKLIIKN